MSTTESASTTPGVLRPVSSLNLADAKVIDLADLLIPWFERLHAVAVAGGPGEHVPAAEIPTDDEVLQWTRSLFTDHRGPLRARKACPTGSSNAERAVHALVRWHRSGGNLEGLFYAKWAAGEAWSRVGTYVTVLLLAAGQSSPALATWARTGLLEAARP